MEELLITAGGTVESIDGVRQIKNTSTGRLCADIYEALADVVSEPDTSGARRAFKVHYVVSETASRPAARDNLPISFYPVTDVKSVESVLENLMTDHNIRYVIHGMAVSDFTKDYLIERDTLVAELAEALNKAFGTDAANPTGRKLEEVLHSVLDRPARQLEGSGKVRSNADLILALKQTPKLIRKFKELNPDCFLVGFKLLNGAAEEELLHVANELADKNGCDLVLANDLMNIGGNAHEALLIKDNQTIGRYHTKKEIAYGLVRHMLAGGHAIEGRGI